MSIDDKALANVIQFVLPHDWLDEDVIKRIIRTYEAAKEKPDELSDGELFACWKAYSSMQPDVLIKQLRLEHEDDLTNRDYVVAKMRMAINKFIELRGVPKRESLSQWQPIETAPSHLAVLIHYKNELGKGRTIKAIYHPRWETEANMDSDDYHEYSEEKDAYFLIEGWYEQIDNWPEYSAVHINEGKPTHWMPLPTPPKGDDIEGGSE